MPTIWTSTPKRARRRSCLPTSTRPRRQPAGTKPTPKEPTASPVLALLTERDDLKGLPLRMGKECQTGDKAADIMGKLSAQVRNDLAKVARKSRSSSSLNTALLRDTEMANYVSDCKGDYWRNGRGVRLLVQMFQMEGPGVRLQLIKNLARTSTKLTSASATLARLAVFDLAAEVREAAVQCCLQKRPRAEWRPVLLAAFRHPWTFAADHAAEALAALDDRDAVFDLIALLDQPDPQAAVRDKDEKWVTPELVRLNHLGNCLLCHAPATGSKDPVPGRVPERGKEIPIVYYADKSGDFVRADVTYLRQDFSLNQAVAEPNKWPDVQRFDFLIRMREAQPEEVEKAVTKAKDRTATYPQRAAVLWQRCAS